MKNSLSDVRCSYSMFFLYNFLLKVDDLIHEFDSLKGMYFFEPTHFLITHL